MYLDARKNLAGTITSINNTFLSSDIESESLINRTLMEWFKNINAQWDQIPQYDLRFKRMWNYYLLASAAGFRSRNLNLNQYVFRRGGIYEPYIPVR
jgi:cyclopropane fatty-acyl-phospholipid synthase-like methyltransferase